MLSQVRWYNVSLLLLGQYLTACFVFAPRDLRWNILLDLNTHLIAWSGALIMAFGFLINSFYDYAVARGHFVGAHAAMLFCFEPAGRQ